MATLLFQLAPGHFTCPLHKWPLPCSTCWALYHTCPFPSSASQPWAPLFQKQATVARGCSHLPRLGGFIWHCWKKNQQTRLSLAHFLVLYGPDNRKRCPCTSQLVSEGHLSALAWPLTGACYERAGWSTSWQKPAWAYPLSVLQGWFHLVTPSDSTLCTERLRCLERSIGFST